MEDDNSKEVKNKITVSNSLPVNQELQTKFNNFLQDELAQLESAKELKSRAEYEKHRDDVAVQNDGRRLIKHIVNAPDEVESFAHVAEKDGKTVGFNVVAISKDSTNREVIGEFVGRSFEAKGLGIASELLRARHKELISRGINEYESGMTDEAKVLFERIGISPELIHTNEAGQKFYRISLK